MSHRKIAVILLAFAFILLPLGMSEDSEGANELTVDSQSLHVGSFNERSAGTISVTLENSSTAVEGLVVDVYVTWLNGDWTKGGDRLASVEGVNIPARTDDKNGSATVDVSFRIGSPGTHHVKIWFVPEGYFPSVGQGDNAVGLNWATAQIDVESSVWSNPVTYVVVIIVILIVVIAVYLRLRSTRTPKVKGRFTEMEMERKAQKERPKIREERIIPAQATDNLDDPFIQDEQPVAPAPVKGTQKQEYTGKVTKTKSKQQSSSSKRKSDPSSRKSSKRK